MLRERYGPLGCSLRAANRAASSACIGVGLSAWVAAFQVPTSWFDSQGQLAFLLAVAALGGAGVGGAGAMVELALAAVDVGFSWQERRQGGGGR